MTAIDRLANDRQQLARGYCARPIRSRTALLVRARDLWLVLKHFECFA